MSETENMAFSRMREREVPGAKRWEGEGALR
jgi:hypothetical protein